jgi:Ca2+-transporting ATPase
MTVQEVYLDGLTDKEFAEWASFACETEPYDPMEKAILAYAKDKGLNKDELFTNKLLFEYPFNSESKMMGHVWDINGNKNLAAKGSPESILPLCGLDEARLASVEKEQLRLAQEGYRVIAVAKRENLTEIPSALNENPLTLLGLIGLADPPRETVPHAVRVCKRAGLRIIMITGDNGATAISIAKKIGITECDSVITGDELENMSDDELKEKVKTINVFARVIPNHKMRIVKALRENNEIVAMTGDGVNDAPALKYADIGIAMGMRGTNVAKEAADMVLLDDNFTTIVDTVKDGRRIYDNIKKSFGYVFVIHIPIALLALIVPLLHLPALLLPIHIVLLELIIDPTCSIVFERLPPERDIMNRKPRQAQEPLVTKGLVMKSLMQGFMIFLAAFLPYFCLINSGVSVAIARSFALSVVVISNLFLVYVNKSDKSFAFESISEKRDSFIIIIGAVILVALLGVIYLPPLNLIAQTAPMSLPLLLFAAGLAAISTLWWEIIKLVKRIKANSIKNHN